MTVMITTVDNPYDPFTSFDEWYQWDTSSGYYTCQFLARLVHTSSDLSDEDQLRAIEAAIDDILAIDQGGIYKKVVLEDGDPDIVQY